MKFKYLALISLIAFKTIADSNNQSLQSTVNNLDNLEHILNPTANNCENEADACQDLFGAACLNPDATFKDEAKLEEKMDAEINAARDAAIKAMGIDNIVNAFKNYLEKNKLPLKKDLSDEKIRDLLTIKNIYNPEVYFENAKDCSNLVFEKLQKLNQFKYTGVQKHQIESAENLLKSSEETLKTYQTRLEEAKKDKNEYIIQLYTQNIKDQKEEYDARKAELDKLKTLLDAQTKEIATLKSEIRNESTENTKTFKNELSFEYKENPNSFYSNFNSLCETVIKKVEEKTKENEEKIKTDPKLRINPKLVNANFNSVCDKRNLYKMRANLIEFYRVSDPTKKEAITKTFLDKLEELNQMKDIDKSWDLNPVSYEENSPEAEEEELKRLSEFAAASCDLHKEAIQKRFGNLHEDIGKKIASSQPVVEHIIKATYSDEQKKNIDKIFLAAKNGFLDFINGELANRPELKGSQTLARIQTEANKLTYTWQKIPPQSVYEKKDDFPLPVLNFSNLSSQESFLMNFADGSLDSLKALNAFYSPKVQMGAQNTPETFTLLPAINYLAESDPIAVMTVTAHELAHKLGPQVSKINGHDLNGSYQELVSCLKSEESIKIEDHQKDEAFADWLAAKIVGQYIMGLPESKRREAALRVGGFFCQANLKHFYTTGFESSDSHSESTLRVNGILGANSTIRKALGCSTPGNYKECKLGKK